MRIPSSSIKKEPRVNASDGIKPREDIEPSYSKSGLSLKAHESGQGEDETISQDNTDTRPFLHRLPDAFAYPFKGSGIVLILVGTVCFSFLDFFASLSVFGFIATAFVACYLCAFMMKIVNSSADGKKELPDWPYASDFWDDIIVPLFQVIWTGIFCFAPAIIYLIFLHFDIFFWLLLAFGILYFPMALISVALTNSVLSINPVLVVPSIIKVPVDYLAACVILTLIALLVNFSQLLVSIIPLAGLVLKNLIGLYFLVVEAHVLGLIYHANKQKLGRFGEGEK